jgi:hypothetical protein
MSKLNPLFQAYVAMVVNGLRKAFTAATTSAGTVGMVPAPEVADKGKVLTADAAWKYENFRGGHVVANDYAAGNWVAINGCLAVANATVAKNTGFNWGTSGATWTPLLDANVSWQGVYNPSASYADNVVVAASHTQGLLYRSKIANNMGKAITDTAAWMPYHPMVDMSNLINAASSTNTSTSPSTVMSKMLLENVQVFASLITGTPVIGLNLADGLVILQTTTPSSNWTLNVTMSATQTLNVGMIVGQSVTFTHLIQMGGTAFMPTSISLDGQLKSELWAGGAKPAAGITNALNCYSYTIIKTADNSFVVLCDQGSFK